MASWFNRLSSGNTLRAALRILDRAPPPVKTAIKTGAIGAGVGGAVFVAPKMLGFKSGGVVAGSMAAGAQSAYYGAAVPAGSVFAVLQSVGATGTIIPSVMAGVGAMGIFILRTRAGRSQTQKTTTKPETKMGNKDES